jgi:(1->4)-alpha-D-glucan 1-alpha-D-glucosylmutase
MNSLAQVVIKTTAPGVPDLYQGNELWELSLVDPDNRRPVDFELRQRLVEELSSVADGDALGLTGIPSPEAYAQPVLEPENGTATPGPQPILSLLSQLLANWRDGRLKLWTTLCALRFRRDHADLFQFGSYTPLYAGGDKQEHVVAFAREHAGKVAVVVVPRLAYSLMEGNPAAPLGDVWGTTELALPSVTGEFVNVLTGERLTRPNGRSLLCREIFAHFPVALLALR